MKRLLVLAALATGLISHAYGQTYPGQVPANTVLGNPTGGPLPFATPGQVANGQLANMAGGTTKCREGGAATGAPTDCTNPIVALDDFGCAGNGSTDDAPCINNAIAALPAAGGRIYATPGKNYCIKSTISIGNGSASAQSTTSGVHFFSTGSTFNFSGAPQTQITWCGVATANAMFVLFGPIKGWGFENLVVNCGSLAGTGIKLIAASYGDNKNLMFNACNNQAIQSVTLATAVTGSPNSQFNEFRNTQIFLPNTANAIGIVLDGDNTDAVTDTNFNYFYNTSIIFPNAGATVLEGLYFKNADTNFFYGLSLFPNGADAGTSMVAFDYSAPGSGGVYPSGNQIFGADIKGISTFAGTQALNIGTPGAAAHANMIQGVSGVNGAVCPALANLSCQSPTQLILGANGNVIGQDLASAWTATYTPAPSCGTATFTVASARSKTFGKTTFVELDTTISALGTCTNSFSFTLPNIANSGGGLAGRQTAGSGAILTCYVSAASATANCAGTANFTANQILLSGSYENQ